MGFFASVNGDIVPAEEARVSVLDNGFAFGDSVYEVLRTYGGQPFEPGRHFRRLRASAARLGFDVPLCDVDLLARADELLARAANPESYIRIIVSRGLGDCSYAFERVAGADVVLVCEGPPPYPECHYARGRPGGARWRTSQPPARARSGDQVEQPPQQHPRACARPRPRGPRSRMLLNLEGFLAEGASTNVFLVRGGTVRPPRSPRAFSPGSHVRSCSSCWPGWACRCGRSRFTSTTCSAPTRRS